jgi:hypothetical protein
VVVVPLRGANPGWREQRRKRDTGRVRGRLESGDRRPIGSCSLDRQTLWASKSPRKNRANYLAEKLGPLRLRFSRIPGTICIVRRNRKLMWPPYCRRTSRRPLSYRSRGYASRLDGSRHRLARPLAVCAESTRDYVGRNLAQIHGLADSQSTRIGSQPRIRGMRTQPF